jgi:hypothetical protein
VGEGEVRVLALKGMHEIGDVESPEKGGQTTTLSQALENRDVDIIIRETMEYVVLDKVMEGANALPEIRRDMIVIKSDE